MAEVFNNANRYTIDFPEFQIRVFDGKAEWWPADSEFTDVSVLQGDASGLLRRSDVANWMVERGLTTYFATQVMLMLRTLDQCTRVGMQPGMIQEQINDLMFPSHVQISDSEAGHVTIKVEHYTARRSAVNY